MLEQKRRFILLAMVMVALVGVVSMLSTWLLYQTSLEEQKHRLHELVQSQASLAIELGSLSLKLELVGGSESTREIVLGYLAKAHKRFQIESKSGEFTVGKRAGPDIRFLIVNGKRVPESSPLAEIPLDSAFADPMEEAIFGESGTMIGLDYSGKEVLAAYTPLPLQYEVLGIVAKIDLEEIKTPFFRANFTIFGFGIVFTLIGLAFFFKLSEPIIQNIQQSEKQYRDLVEGANSLIVRIDGKGVITFANMYASGFLVAAGLDLVGLHIVDILFEEKDKANEIESIDDVVALFGQGDGPHELALPPDDGRIEWISWTLRRLEYDNELLCVGYNITAQRMARDAQREIEERFQGIAKASPVGIVITDVEGNLIYANERMHELVGCDAVELVGKGWLNQISRKDRQSLVFNWFSEGPVSFNRLEFRLDLKERHLWILGQIVDLKNSDGEAVGYVITLTDITNLKIAESEQKRLTAAIDQAAEAIVITDLKGAISYVNPAFEQITGYLQEEAVGKNPRILKSGEQDKAFYKDLWATITAGKVWTGRFINLRKDGKRYTQESTIGPVRDESGNITNYVGVSRDISDQLLIEAQLRQAQKLESIGELAAGIAHEINTPTQYVATNAKFIEESCETLLGMLDNCKKLVKAVQEGRDREEILKLADISLDEKELSYLAEDIPNALSESETGLKRIAEIVQSVKQLAHPGEVHKGLHRLNEIVTNAVTVSSNEWKYVADIDLNLDDTIPDIYCLKGEVGQVVLNLIVNGAHAIESKIGTNAAEKGKLTLRTYLDENNVVLTVADTGTGIPKDVVERIFDPFFTTKDIGKGTGQGLAIAHNVIVNMHCGDIDVVTDEGNGTTFIVKLPIDGECPV